MNRKPAFRTTIKPSRVFLIAILMLGLSLNPIAPRGHAARSLPADGVYPSIAPASRQTFAGSPEPGVIPAEAKPSAVIIDEFESEASLSGWVLSPTANAAGDFDLTPVGYYGHGAVLTYDLDAAYASISVTRSFTTSLPAYGVECWFKTSADIDLQVTVVVSGTIVRPPPSRPFHAWSTDHWYRYRVQFPGPGEIWSLEIRAMHNIQYPVTVGTLYVDSIVALTEPIEYDLAASSKQVGSTLADMSNFQDIMGTHNPDLNYPDERALDLAVELGTQYIRSNAVRWHYLEQKKKVFNFDAADAVVAANQARGFTTVFVVAGGNPIYTGTWDNPPLTEDELDVFGRYIDAVAARYAGRNLVYDIWSEPVQVLWNLSPAQFTAIIKTASEHIRAVDPSATIISGGLLDFNTGYLQGMIDAGFANYVDGFGVHCYYIRDPENLSRYAHHIRSYLKEHGGIALPIWDTEWGYHSSPIGAETAEQALQRHGRIVARQLLSAWANDLSSVIYYSYRDTFEAYSSGDMGLLEIDYDPKPAFQAAKTIHQFTANKKLVGSLSTLPVNYYGLKLENDQGVSFVLWSADKLTSLKVILPPSASAIDYLGSSVAVDAANAFALSDQNGPVFVACPSCARTLTSTFLPLILGAQ